MFDKPYEFKYLNSQKAYGELFEKKHLLSFRSHTNHRYIVEVEEYPHDFYGIKYYLKANAQSDERYRILTGLNQATRVIRTCIDVMLYFINERNPLASFIFIGAQLQSEDNYNNTKRFRVYSRIMENFFNPLKFSHFFIEKSSMYVILNKSKLKDDPKALQKMEKIAVEFYEIEGKNEEENPY